MSKYIPYEAGQKLGPYGIVYIKEVTPYITPSTHKKVRQAEFECPFCEEHKHFISRISYIKSGHTKSCGCMALKASVKTIERYNNSEHEVWNRIKLIPNQIVNEHGVIYLKDISPYLAPSTGRPYRQCEFKCPICGRTFTSLLNNVTRGLVKGCGIHQSYGEEKIATILEEHNITYIREYSFQNLTGKSGHPLFFDFYLPNDNICIEYDGIQHFEYRKNSNWHTPESFKESQQRDRQKDLYCAEHDIGLIRIPYTDFEDIDSDYLFDKIKEVNKLCVMHK